MADDKIKKHIQLPNLGTLITLYELDLSPLGTDTVLRFTNSADNRKPIKFRGQLYTPIAMEASGFEYDGQSAFPTPEISIGNVDGYLNQYMQEYEDFIGARFTRIRTFDKFLDEGEDPNPDARLPDDRFVVEQKINQNKVFISFRLSTSIDQEGRKVPGRVALKTTCIWRYRYWNKDKDISGLSSSELNYNKDPLNTPSEWEGVYTPQWERSAKYDTGDIVRYENSFYEAKKNVPYLDTWSYVGKWNIGRYATAGSVQIAAHPDPNQRVQFYISNTRSNGSVYTKFTQADIGTPIKIVVADNNAPEGTPNVNGTYTGEIVRVIDFESPRDDPFGGANYSAILVAVSEAGEHRFLKGLANRPLRDATGTGGTVTIERRTPTINQNPTLDTDNWSPALTTVDWSGTAAYSQGDYTVHNETLYTAKRKVPDFNDWTNVGKWNIGRYATAGSVQIAAHPDPNQRVQFYISNTRSNGSVYTKFTQADIGTPIKIVVADNNAPEGTPNVNGTYTGEIVRVIDFESPRDDPFGGANYSAILVAVSEAGEHRFLKGLANRPLRDATGTGGTVTIERRTPTINQNPTQDTTRWNALTTVNWSGTAAYPTVGTYVERTVNSETKVYKSKAAISAPSGGTTYTEVARWNDTSANYRTANEADYTSHSTASWCANRAPLNNVADPFPLNTSTTYRLRYVQGGSATQASAQIIGTPTQTHIDESPGGGIACYRFGSAANMTAAFGNPVSNPNSPSSFNGGQWILEEQTASSSNTEPENDSTNWSPVSTTAWSNTSSYDADDYVSYSNNYYRAVSNIDAGGYSFRIIPSQDSTNWDPIIEDLWNKELAYKKGSYVHQFETYTSTTFWWNRDVEVTNNYLYKAKINIGAPPLKFEYEKSTSQCPYVGKHYYNEKNEPVSDPAQDRCSKSLKGCRLRFNNPDTGVNEALPLSFFPGINAHRRLGL